MIHKAGKPSLLVQRCSRCGVELKRKGLFEALKSRGWWKVGGSVEFHNSYSMGAVNDQPNCAIPIHKRWGG